MTSNNDLRSSLSDHATLGVLNAIEESGETLTQRSLAFRLGVALGLTNSLLKRCVRKGLVKVKAAPPSRYAYYLTPQGFAEKSRLVSEYLSSSLSFFRLAREQYFDVFDRAEERGWRRIALYGTGELAEIALLSCRSAGVTPECVLAPGSNQSQFLGIPIRSDISTVGDLDAIVLAASDHPQGVYDKLSQSLPNVAIVAVPLLHVSSTKGIDSVGAGA